MSAQVKSLVALQLLKVDTPSARRRSRPAARRRGCRPARSCLRRSVRSWTRSPRARRIRGVPKPRACGSSRSEIGTAEQIWALRNVGSSGRTPGRTCGLRDSPSQRTAVGRPVLPTRLISRLGMIASVLILSRISGAAMPATRRPVGRRSHRRPSDRSYRDRLGTGEIGADARLLASLKITVGQGDHARAGCEAGVEAQRAAAFPPLEAGIGEHAVRISASR